MATLKRKVHKQIKALCVAGDEALEAGDHDRAIDIYNDAFDLLPEPKIEWDAALWIMAAIGDAAFQKGSFKLAEKVLSDVMWCEGAIGNPFLHLRLGEACFELDDLDRAAGELLRAYIGAGEDVFEGEDDKYLAFLATRANLP